MIVAVGCNDRLMLFDREVNSLKEKRAGNRKSAVRKNTLREIMRTKSRFIAILAIIGISVGFFSGLKSSAPSMITTALQYFEDTRLMDIRLVSTIGFDDTDIRELSERDDVDAVMPGYMADVIITQDNVDKAVRIYSVPQKTETNREVINQVILKDGRMPKGEGECAIESYFLGMSGYQLGDTIELNASVNGKDTTSMVKHLKYKIVGVVDSPMYLTYLRGNTTIGDGTVTFYMFLPPEEFAYERFTVAYLQTKASEGHFTDLTDEYKDTIKEEKEQLEAFSGQCIQRFNETTLADAQKELSDAQKEYQEKKDEALKKLEDGARELTDGEREFYEKTGDGRKELEDGQKELEEAKEKLKAGQEEYKTGIEQAKQKLTDAQAQYDQGLAQYTAAKSEYDAQAQNFYSVTKPQAESQLSMLKTAIDLCNRLIQSVEERLDKLKSRELIDEVAGESIDELKDTLTEYRKQLDELQKQYDEGKQQLAQGEEQLNAARQQLDAAKIQLDAAAGQLATGKLEYETALTTGAMELQSAQTQITEGEAKLRDGKAELAEQLEAGMLKLKQGREELAKGRYEAKVQLEDAEGKLSEAEDKLSGLTDAKWYIYDRDDNPGYSGLSEDAERVDSISQVFPVFFLLIAGLVCFTTMTRMVEERRTETGTLKALGYSNFAIAKKYLIYGGAAALAGSIAGGALGVLTLPVIIVNTYGIMYTLPPTILTVNWTSLVLSSVVGIVCICLVSLATVYRDLTMQPATLMRPKAPKPGKRILLEYIRPLWKHMNFTSKVTARNLFRYKARFFMTVIGVAGCTALIVAAFGLRDSITGIADLQFQQLTRYDQIYALSESNTAQKQAYLMSQFHKDDRFENTLLGNMTWGSVADRDEHKTMTVRMMIGDNEEQFRQMFILRDRKSHGEIRLSDDGVVLTERIGEVLGVKTGDEVILTLNDEKYPCKVTAFTENYAGSLGYMTPEYYEKLTGKPVEYGLIFTRVAEDYRSMEHDIANDYMKNDSIITVTSITEQVDTMMDMVSSLDFIVFVMIFCAGLLAVVVLYNLTNINIAERVREIATIKVLGFYSMESANFIYRESVVLTLIGTVCGLALGSVFANFIIEAIQMDNVMFPKVISFWSYANSFVLTFVFALFVNFIMYFKMNKISMVESLKSIE